MNSVTQNGFWRKPLLLALWVRITRLWHKAGVRGTRRQLRLCESLSLGEKRFVAVVAFESERFLIGGGAGTVNLLARLGDSADFPEVLSEWCERQR